MTELKEWEYNGDFNMSLCFGTILRWYGECREGKRDPRGCDITKGEVPISILALSKETGLLRKTVKSCCLKLENQGLIHVDSRPKNGKITVYNANIYTYNIQNIAQKKGTTQQSENQRISENYPEKGYNSTPKKGTTQQSENQRISENYPEKGYNSNGQLYPCSLPSRAGHINRACARGYKYNIYINNILSTITDNYIYTGNICSSTIAVYTDNKYSTAMVKDNNIAPYIFFINNTGINTTRTREAVAADDPISAANIQNEKSCPAPDSEWRDQRPFQPPTADEVREACRRLGIENVNHYRFWLYYDSIGWRVGGMPLVNWQSKLRQWSIDGKGSFGGEKKNAGDSDGCRLDPEKIIKWFNDVVAYTASRIPPLREVTEQRLAATEALYDKYGRESFMKTVEKAVKLPVLNGNNKHGWVASFDWICRPDKFLKILEGEYDSHKTDSKIYSYANRDSLGGTMYPPIPGDFHK